MPPNHTGAVDWSIPDTRQWDGVTVSFAARSVRLTTRQVELLRPPLTDDFAVPRFLRSLDENPPRLSAEILAVKRVAAGAGVSYGHTFRAPVATTLALVAIGYGHGIPRKAGNRASVTWGELRMPIVGRVAMDVLVVDVGKAPAQAGEIVVFFGDPRAQELSLAEWSDSVGEHPFSVVASLDHRVTLEVSG